MVKGLHNMTDTVMRAPTQDLGLALEEQRTGERQLWGYERFSVLERMHRLVVGGPPPQRRACKSKGRHRKHVQASLDLGRRNEVDFALQ